MSRLISEYLVVGEDDLDALNKKVNSYIGEGYQPKDPMLEIQNVDGQQYHYTQTLVKYIEDPHPSDPGELIVKYLRGTGILDALDQIEEDQWKKWVDAIIKDFTDALENMDD